MSCDRRPGSRETGQWLGQSVRSGNSARQRREGVSGETGPDLPPVRVLIDLMRTRTAALNQPADVALGPGPRKLGNVAACGSSVQVTLLKVDATISPGEAGLVRRVAEGCPAKRQVAGRHGAGLELRAPGWKR